MTCLSATRKVELRADLAGYKASLVTLKAEYDLALTKPDSYKFDSGEGSQQVKSRKLEELEKSMTFLEGKIRSINNKLNGGGITSSTVRRRGHSYGGY